MIKGIVDLPVTNQTMETDTFSQIIGLSGGEQLEISGEYAIITTDNVQIHDLVYSASYSKGVMEGETLSFLGATWTLDSYNCNTKTVTLNGPEDSLVLKDGETYYNYWKAGVTCTSGKLSSLKYSLTRKKTATKGDIVYVPDSSMGYELVYQGKGIFEVQ